MRYLRVGAEDKSSVPGIVLALFLPGVLIPVFRYDYLEKALLYPERRFSRSPLILLSVLLSTVFSITVLLEF